MFSLMRSCSLLGIFNIMIERSAPIIFGVVNFHGDDNPKGKANYLDPYGNFVASFS